MMGRADNDIVDERSRPSENGNDEEVEDVLDIIEDVESINNRLDELNSALDILEQENESIQARLLELLLSNRELRETNQQQQQVDQTSGDR